MVKIRFVFLKSGAKKSIISEKSTTAEQLFHEYVTNKKILEPKIEDILQDDTEKEKLKRYIKCRRVRGVGTETYLLDETDGVNGTIFFNKIKQLVQDNVRV